MSETGPLLALFPGQGSQQVGMGHDLHENSCTARKLFERADQVLGFSLSQICFAGPLEKLTATEIVQPALLTVSTIVYQLAKEKLGDALQVVSAAGHSLGEYSALVAAGAISFEDAVLLVHKRGRFMQEAVPAGAGKMLAVLGKDLAELEELVSQTGDAVDIANVNAPGQVVLSGPAEAIDDTRQQLGKAKVVELNVSAPFHSRLMAPAAEQLAAELAQTSFKPCRFPVYSNFSASQMTQPEQVRAALQQQVCGRVRWVECVERAIAETEAARAIEFGTGTVLSGLLRRICKGFPHLSIGTTSDIEKL